ncbi:MAG: DegV family EDD domain-containing protein [Candidatus Marinimicrobia bacterium]|nr:DegV family EDD domain-containing protein [Candidatus Neomarinimicrobiota bacterium]
MKIIIGNTCNFEPERIKELGLGLIDYPVYLNGKEYPQYWDMPNWREEKEKFIKLLRDKNNKGTTVGITEKQFTDMFEEYKDEEILLITQSLNNTHATRDALRKVLKDYPQYDVKAFDTESLASGVGVQAMAMFKEAEGKDLSRDELYDILVKNRPNAHVVGVLYDLFYLSRSGRIGLAKAVLATAMGLYPLLSSTPQSGVIKSIGKVKNYKQANARFLATIKSQMQEKNSKRLTATMSYVTDHDKECLHLKKMLEAAAEELGWDVHIEINYASFALLPHMGPDFYEMGYVIGT